MGQLITGEGRWLAEAAAGQTWGKLAWVILSEGVGAQGERLVKRVYFG